MAIKITQGILCCSAKPEVVIESWTGYAVQKSATREFLEWRERGHKDRRPLKKTACSQRMMGKLPTSPVWVTRFQNTPQEASLKVKSGTQTDKREREREREAWFVHPTSKSWPSSQAQKRTSNRLQTSNQQHDLRKPTIEGIPSTSRRKPTRLILWHQHYRLYGTVWN